MWNHLKIFKCYIRSFIKLNPWCICINIKLIEKLATRCDLRIYWVFIVHDHSKTFIREDLFFYFSFDNLFSDLWFHSPEVFLIPIIRALSNLFDKLINVKNFSNKKKKNEPNIPWVKSLKCVGTFFIFYVVYAECG